MNKPAHEGLADAIKVMDTLRSEGGCPWDAEQTHESLVKYLLEESHELAEAIEQRDRANMREELGDVLLQVLFHARIAQEHQSEPFGIDEVAQDLADKLRFRHPHVFADAQVADAVEVTQNWEALKKQEKQRESVLDGIPRTMGALARAQKMVSRVNRDERIVNALASVSENVDNSNDAVKIGNELLDLVRRAARQGVDAEGALRQALTEFERDVRSAESSLLDHP